MSHSNNAEKEILIFCPWINLENLVGIFFIEQAEIIKPEYSPILINFQPKRLSVNNIFKLTDINKERTNSGMLLLKVYYPSNLPKVFSTLERKLELKALRDLKKFLQTNNINPRLIHAQTLFNDGIRAFKYSVLFNIPFVISEHNQLSFRNQSKVQTMIAINALRSAQVLIAISSDKIRQFAANWLFPNFEFIGNLVGETFHFKHKDINQKASYRIMTVGAYTPIKDQLTMLKALKIVDENINFEIEFLWAGTDGWGISASKEAQTLLDTFEFVNIKTRIIPLLNREDLAVEYNYADLFLFSSLSEGMPVSVLEALACGLPVVTTNCGGVDDIINIKNGRICPVRDFSSMAGYILDFLHGRITVKKKSISEDIISRFGPESFKARLLGIYDAIG